MKDNRKTIKIALAVHQKMKKHLVNTNKKVNEFTEFAIQQQIRTDKLEAKILKSK